MIKMHSNLFKFIFVKNYFKFEGNNKYLEILGILSLKITNYIWKFDIFWYFYHFLVLPP